MKGAVNNFPPRLADGPQEPRFIKKDDVFEARGQRFARRLDDDVLPAFRQVDDARDRLGRLAPRKFAAVASIKCVRFE